VRRIFQHKCSKPYFTKVLFRHVFFVLFVLVASGCASKSRTSDPLMNGLLLSEPEMVSTKAQISVAHYTDSLYRVKFTEKERAEVLFQRGIAYDAMGLISLARMDYSEALKLNPALADAHNSIGVLYIQAGMYMLAYESFDSTLEINEDYDFALLNRAIALYYGGRTQLALSDTLEYLQKDSSDPFRLLWHFIVYSQNSDKEDALKMLAQARMSLPEDNWATTLVDFYLGNVPENAVIARLLSDVNSQTELNYRLCEAYFYLGKHSAFMGNKTKAENYFKLSLGTNVYEYIEHKYSRIELANVRRTRREEMQAN
jgi:lipoprotein NlpI